MKSKRTLIVGIVAALAVAVCAFFYLNNRETVPEYSIEIVNGDETVLVDLDALELVDVKGETVNGKGDVSQVEAKGVEVESLLADYDIKDYTTVTAEADDAYSASVTAEEVKEDGKVYLLVDENKQASLLVFGDQNSKRNVRNLIRLVVE